MKKTNTKNNSNHKISAKKIELKDPIREFLINMGEDVTREGLKDTPERFEKAMKAVLSGYDRSFKDENRTFENSPKYKGMILLKNIDFFSICEHHLFPFFGYAHIAYIPSDKEYLGISKLARLVDIYARRLQTQEVLSSQIAEALMRDGKARGVAIMIESKHLCAVARGVEKRAAIMSTLEYYGEFEKNEKLRNDFMELLRDREMEKNRSI